MALLAHPIDVHYAVKGIDGWPRLRLEVYGVDVYGRVELAGYGCCIVPTSAGTHELTCATWRPCGSLREQMSSAPHCRNLPHTRARAPHAHTRAANASTVGADGPILVVPAFPSCAAFFLGGAPRLKQKDIVSKPTDRFRLQTEPAGEVMLKLSVMPKDLARYGVLC